MKCEGLDAEQLARRSVPPSTMSLLGLIRHLAEVEQDWRGWILPGDQLPKLYGAGDADFDGAVADQAVVDAAYTDLAREQAATDAALSEHPDLGERHPAVDARGRGQHDSGSRWQDGSAHPVNIWAGSDTSSVDAFAADRSCR